MDTLWIVILFLVLLIGGFIVFLFALSLGKAAKNGDEQIYNAFVEMQKAENSAWKSTTSGSPIDYEE